MKPASSEGCSGELCFVLLRFNRVSNLVNKKIGKRRDKHASGSVYITANQFSF